MCTCPLYRLCGAPLSAPSGRKTRQRTCTARSILRTACLVYTGQREKSSLLSSVEVGRSDLAWSRLSPPCSNNSPCLSALTQIHTKTYTAKFVGTYEARRWTPRPLAICTTSTTSTKRRMDASSSQGHKTQAETETRSGWTSADENALPLVRAALLDKHGEAEARLVRRRNKASGVLDTDVGREAFGAIASRLGVRLLRFHGAAAAGGAGVGAGGGAGGGSIAPSHTVDVTRVSGGREVRTTYASDDTFTSVSTETAVSVHKDRLCVPITEFVDGSAGPHVRMSAKAERPAPQPRHSIRAKHTRAKRRWSVPAAPFRLDLTEVREGTTLEEARAAPPAFEVELEYVGPRLSADDDRGARQVTFDLRRRIWLIVTLCQTPHASS